MNTPLTDAITKTEVVQERVFADIKPTLLSGWQKHLKRLIDIVLACLGLILFAPLMLYLAMRVFLSSPGPIIYRQQRIGLNGKPFTILKFRSMVANAENGLPMLSSRCDPRITSFGKLMRQWRLDELPQLWNILKGDMSLVGPRPERVYYINKLLQHNSRYNQLLSVKPGLTSWGMVKFGYAENIDEMIERMQYDLRYLKNLSIGLDLKIMGHTIMIFLRKEGR